eukprot:6456401-Amphidinium_carterae.1
MRETLGGLGCRSLSWSLFRSHLSRPPHLSQPVLTDDLRTVGVCVCVCACVNVRVLALGLSRGRRQTCRDRAACRGRPRPHSATVSVCVVLRSRYLSHTSFDEVKVWRASWASQAAALFQHT